MKRITTVLAIMIVLTLVLSLSQVAVGQDDEIVVYMQMGGNLGDGATLARTNGAKMAAEHYGITLVEQYSGWDQATMIDQFKQALAANPDAIVIMGHPGEPAFEDLVAEAIDAGIIITSGNNPLPTLQAMYQEQGFGYAGADLYDGGYLTGQTMVAAGNLQPGDEALVYGLFHEEGRSVSPTGVVDALTDAGLVVDTLDISVEVNSEASLAIPVLTGYMEAHPDLKAIGTQHGAITLNMPIILEAAGKEPGDIVVGGIDLSPGTIQGIRDGWITASFDQVLFLQGYYPIQQVWLTKMFKIPGLSINTGVGMVTQDNIEELAPLIEAGYR
jgi:simple sugar transport system substrate-binding protein